MTYAKPEALVGTDWLAAHLEAPDIRVVEATWHHPTTGLKGCDDYRTAHIPGAVFFDIDAIADRSTGLPHMVPDAALFAASASRLGLDSGHHIVVYDRSGGAGGAARTWWTFRVFGHRDVSVLDGGLGKWQAEGRPVDDRVPMPGERRFVARFQSALVRAKAQILDNIGRRREQVIDARSAERFAGRGVEPWPHIKVGHIPGSLNLPWERVLDPKTGTILPANILRERFEEAGLDIAGPTVASCGSGVTASMLTLALYLLGNYQVAIYDGAWAEWGNAADTPAELE